MNYYTLGSDGGSCNFIQHKNQPIGYSDGQPFISANSYDLFKIKVPNKNKDKNKKASSIN